MKLKDNEEEEISKKILNNDSLSESSSSPSIQSSDLRIIKEKYKNEIAKLENFYDEILKNKMTEYEQILAELNEKLVEKENELEQFKNDNIEIREKYNDLVDIYHESEEAQASYKHMLLELKEEYETIKEKLDNLTKKTKNDNQSNNDMENLNIET